jgi:hypothetical protein
LPPKSSILVPSEPQANDLGTSVSGSVLVIPAIPKTPEA